MPDKEGGRRAIGACRPDSDMDLVIPGQLDARTINHQWTLFHESNLPVAVDVMRHGFTTCRPLREQTDAAKPPRSPNGI